MGRRWLVILLCCWLGVPGPAVSAQPSDTLTLWEKNQVPFARDVQFYAFRPEKPNGISVIVCPGGSYYWHDKTEEGMKVGEWLRGKGITAFVLFYRAAGKAEIAFHSRLVFRGKRHPDMITDAQRALQYVREHASEYQIDPERVGMMGFSAGGHLVMSAACFSSSDFLGLSGVKTSVSLRPAFVVPVYPVVTMNPPYVHKRSRCGLLGDSRAGNQQLRDSLSLERHIPDDCPPVFLVNCKDDPIVPYQNSELLEEALSKKGIPHRYLQYERGKHGFGVSDELGSPECRQWRNEFLRWIGALYSLSL